MKIFFPNIETYDLQGNILSLTRYGLTSGVTAATAQREYGVVNQIVNGTKGHIIAETQNENSLWPTYGSQTYLPSGTYDDNTFDYNGNLTFDEMRETSFKYNHLNLSTKITNPGDTMLIQYDALGNKVRQISGNDTLYFVGGAIYECKMQSAECKMQILTENGYIKDGMYHYFVKDYLGNNRLVLNEYGMIVQKNNYYPFGMTQLVDAEQQDAVPYKFSGKELESDGGLNWYDFAARFYDASTGRFGQIDPMAEKYYPISRYAYCGNNPTRFVDPTGMYSTEEWMRDNNITDEDLIRIYTAPDEESETTTNDGDDSRDEHENENGNGNENNPSSSKQNRTSSASMAPALPLWLTMLHIFTKASATVGTAAAGAVAIAVTPLIFLTGDTRIDQMSKTAKGNHRDDGLEGLTNEDITYELQKLRSGNLTKEQKAQKQRLEKEQKVRGERNKQKRESNK